MTKRGKNLLLYFIVNGLFLTALIQMTVYNSLVATILIWMVTLLCVLALILETPMIHVIDRKLDLLFDIACTILMLKYGHYFIGGIYLLTMLISFNRKGE